MAYHDDYEREPIGGGNPYYRCIHCKLAAPEINGRLEGHSLDCEYRLGKESGASEPSQRMVHAAVREAVSQGLLPKSAHGESEYLKMHNQIEAVLKAALDAK
ncbi:hypothetical protein [Acidovorax sp.]|uniref:hypothetical protein n=1 Tax=Acidovorax sp. TaxID=1872122 RepID=UPI00391F7BF9